MHPVVVVQARGPPLSWTAFRDVMTRFAFAAPSSQARRWQRARGRQQRSDEGHDGTCGCGF